MTTPSITAKGGESKAVPLTSTTAALPESPRYTPEDPPSIQTLRRQRYDTRWKQQRNYSFRCEYTFLKVLIYSALLGVILLILGGVSYSLASTYPKVIVQDYTNCKDNVTGNGKECFSEFPLLTPPSKFSNSACKCVVDIHVDDENLGKGHKMLLYYELENFFQNTRVYKKDVEWKQMEGKLFEGNKPVSSPRCAIQKGDDNKYIYPCGKVANSYFSDVFKIFEKGSGKELALDPTGIAWSSDKNKRFKNPSNWDLVKEHYSLPKDWHNEQKAMFLKESTTSKRGVENEHFLVWMRAASLSKFRKKYAYITGLKKGWYRVEIDYRYEVKSFRGKKRIVIAADHGSLPIDLFFCYGFVITGIICLILGPLFYGIDVTFRTIYKRRLLRESQGGVESNTDIPSQTKTEQTENNDGGEGKKVRPGPSPKTMEKIHSEKRLEGPGKASTANPKLHTTIDENKSRKTVGVLSK